MKKGLLVLFFVTCIQLSLNAQLTVETANTPEQIEEALQALFGIGVDIENIEVHCGEDGFGSFEATDFLVSNGLILATGPATNAAQPNTSPSTGAALNSDVTEFAPLDAIAANAGVALYDYCFIEFDITALGDQFEFNYIFASEEYPEWVCSAFNDLMGIFLTSEQDELMCEQISMVPDTDYPVMIGTINGGSGANGQETCENSYPGLNAPANPEYFIENYDIASTYGEYLTYDGLTTVLPAIASVTPYETYHIKMGVADAGDQIFDSAIFVEHGSFYSEGFILSIAAPANNNTNENGQTEIPDNESTEVTFEIGNFPPEGGIIALTFEGTAINGTHFEYIEPFIELGTGKANPSILINPIEENVAGQQLTLKVTVTQLQTPENEFTINQSKEFVIVGHQPNVGITQINNNQVFIHPNPASSFINVELKQQFENATHKIYDIKGQEQISIDATNNQATIDVSQLNNGIYWYQLVNEIGNVINQQKLVIVK